MLCLVFLCEEVNGTKIREMLISGEFWDRRGAYTDSSSTSMTVESGSNLVIALVFLGFILSKL